jgi:hypothetical protein
VGSSSSSDAARLAPPTLGSQVAGFRVERVLAQSDAATVYEATQLSLNRRLALKLLGGGRESASERLRALRWPEHPNVVTLYDAGVSEHGCYLAMQLVGGGETLARVLRRPTRSRAALGRNLEEIAAALDAAHRDRIVHGAVRADNVLIAGDGRALLTNFGLSSERADAAADRLAFAGLVHDCTGADVPAPIPPTAAELVPALPGRSRRKRAAALVVAAGAAITIVLASIGGGAQGVLPVLPGTSILGSTLTGAGLHTLDCRSQPATGASDQCTIVQTRLGGRPAVPMVGGVIRRWTVRGARGQLALQVLRRRGDRYIRVAETPYMRIPDAGVHAMPAELPVGGGDLVGLEVAPGTAIGLRPGVRGASLIRWFGPIEITARRIEPSPGLPTDQELMLRVEYEPGARWRAPGELTGAAAARAVPGRSLATYVEHRGNRQVATLTVVRLGGAVAVDLFAGGRRAARLPVPGLEADGALVSFGDAGLRLNEPVIRLTWHERTGIVVHDYTATASSLVPIS